MFSLELCKSKAAYKATLGTPYRLDIDRVKASEPIILDGGLVIIVRINGIDTVIHEYGELMIKTGDETLAHAIAHHMEAYVHERNERRAPA